MPSESFNRDEIPTVETVDKLVYLDAVIKETSSACSTPSVIVLKKWLGIRLKLSIVEFRAWREVLLLQKLKCQILSP